MLIKQKLYLSTGVTRNIYVYQKSIVKINFTVNHHKNHSDIMAITLQKLGNLHIFDHFKLKLTSIDVRFNEILINF